MFKVHNKDIRTTLLTSICTSLLFFSVCWLWISNIYYRVRKKRQKRWLKTNFTCSSISCRNQSIDLHYKSMDWFLNDRTGISVMKELNLFAWKVVTWNFVSLSNWMFVQKRIVIQKQPPEVFLEISQNGLENASGLQLN